MEAAAAEEEEKKWKQEEERKRRNHTRVLQSVLLFINKEVLKFFEGLHCLLSFDLFVNCHQINNRVEKGIQDRIASGVGLIFGRVELAHQIVALPIVKDYW